MEYIVDQDPFNAWNQANMDAWMQVLQQNMQQQQQTNVGQALAAQPSQQVQQTQPQQVQQQVASQQQAPASVSQPQAVDQAQSQVPVQKIGTPPANVGMEGQGFDAGNGQITYQGEGHFNPVYDEMGQVVQNNWISDVPTRLSDADTSPIVTTGTGQKISQAALDEQMYGKQVGDYNLNLPQIEQGGLSAEDIAALGKFQNNPNFYGGVFDPSKWEEAGAFYNPGVRESAEELGGTLAQGGDPTDYAGRMETLRGQEHLALRNKETGEVIPYYQLFREFPQQAADINTKIAEYARSKPWWKTDLAPDVIKGISAAIAAAGGAAIGGALAGTGTAAGGAAGGAAGTAAGVTIPEAVGAGLGSAAATNATMEGDIGDRLLPTAISFGAGAAMPYVTNYLGQGWNAVKDYLPSWGSGGTEDAITSGIEAGADVGMPPPEYGEVPFDRNLPFDQQSVPWSERGPGKYTEYPTTPEQFEEQLIGNRYGRNSWDYEMGDSAQRAFDELGNQQFVNDVAQGLTVDPATGQPYLDPEATQMLNEMFPDNPLSPQSLDQWVQDLNNQSWTQRYIENTPLREYDNLNVRNQDFVEWLYNNSWNGQPLSALDRYGGWSLSDIPWSRIVSLIPAINTLVGLLSGGGGGEGGGVAPTSVHAGGEAEAQPDFSELAGLLARGAGGGGGGATGPSAGSAKGGGFGEGGMMALMNLVLNEMQKGGKYYFQT